VVQCVSPETLGHAAEPSRHAQRNKELRHDPPREPGRLTGREVERFTRITGIEPVGVKSLDDLDDYIGRCKDYYQGASHEARFLRWLLDEERSRCLCAA
jgi:hypothetical protein